MVALVLGPWLGYSAPASAPAAATDPWVVLDESPALVSAQTSAEPARPGATVCNCRTVEVNLKNTVRNARVRTGDAYVENVAVTYVSNDYGDREVDVEQEAEAVSGNAIAGQLVGVDARGPGCVNVRVNAVNSVQSSTVRSGDATAINRGVVLLDPGVNRGDLEVEIDQEAQAHSGDAIAGQLIGIVGGNRVGGCGGRVDLRAVNHVRDTTVLTGNATFLNDADIRYCKRVGCAEELRALLGTDAEVKVCRADDCDRVRGDELGELLEAEAGRVEAEDDSEETRHLDDDDDAVSCAPPTNSGATTEGIDRTPQEEAATEPTPSPTPTPTPAPSPPGCASPSPEPARSPEPAGEAGGSG